MSNSTGSGSEEDGFDTSQTRDSVHTLPCDACRDKWFLGVSELATHVERAHDISFKEYLSEKPLHRCPYCEAHLTDPSTYICKSCSDKGVHPDPHEAKVPCQYCGEKWVNPDDPFCSPACASLRMQYGPPLTPPRTTDSSWSNGTYRHADGILSCSPHLAQHEFVCRHCYLYSSDEARRLGLHVTKKHDINWEEYIELYRLNRCRVCDTPLRTLSSHYCSQSCQVDDPDPVGRCERDGCETPVDKNNIYCSSECGHIAENQSP
jgi:hypothetical protein